jgi:hypothetical protein
MIFVFDYQLVIKKHAYSVVAKKQYFALFWASLGACGLSHQ